MGRLTDYEYRENKVKRQPLTAGKDDDDVSCSGSLHFHWTQGSSTLALIINTIGGVAAYLNMVA
jgi:hypothetical protein